LDTPSIAAAKVNEDRMLGSVPDVRESKPILGLNMPSSLRQGKIELLVAKM
jgi:hypothetical protein